MKRVLRHREVNQNKTKFNLARKLDSCRHGHSHWNSTIDPWLRSCCIFQHKRQKCLVQPLGIVVPMGFVLVWLFEHLSLDPCRRGHSHWNNRLVHELHSCYSLQCRCQPYQVVEQDTLDRLSLDLWTLDLCKFCCNHGYNKVGLVFHIGHYTHRL